MLDWSTFQHPKLAFIAAFLVAGAFTIAFKYIYQWITPYHERTLIRDGNSAAAITLGGALIGYVLPLTSALANTTSLVEFAIWAGLAAVIQVVTFIVVSKVAFRDITARIEAGDMAPSIYLASVSICIGLINAACMTA